MYLSQLDVSHEATPEMVHQFAQEHGCVAKLILENGPAGGNPLYQFSSDKIDCLEELVGQILGFADQQHIRDQILEI